jgi:hypothetical protein
MVLGKGILTTGLDSEQSKTLMVSTYFTRFTVTGDPRTQYELAEGVERPTSPR